MVYIKKISIISPIIKFEDLIRASSFITGIVFFALFISFQMNFIHHLKPITATFFNFFFFFDVFKLIIS